MSKQPPLFIDMKDIEARRWLINLIDREGMGNAKDTTTELWHGDAASGKRKNITYEFMGESEDQYSEKSDFEKENYTQESNTSGKYWFRKDDDEKIGKKYHFSEHPMVDKNSCNTCPNSGSHHALPTATCLRKSRPKGRLAGIPYRQVEDKKRPPLEGKEGKGGRRKKTKKRKTRKRKQTRRRRRKRK